MKNRMLSLLLTIILCATFIPAPVRAADPAAAVTVSGVTTKYDTLIEALKAAENADAASGSVTVTLLRSIPAEDSNNNSDGKVQVETSGIFTLDLKEFDIGPTFRVLTGGDVTIKGNGEIGDAGNSVKQNSVSVASSGKVTIEGGTYGNGLKIVGEATINGGKFKKQYSISSVHVNKGKLTVNGGEVGTLLVTNGTAQLYGGCFAEIQFNSDTEQVTLNDLLPDGFALQKNGKLIKRSTLGNSINEDIRVVKCTEHSYEGDKCIYCAADESAGGTLEGLSIKSNRTDGGLVYTYGEPVELTAEAVADSGASGEISYQWYLDDVEQAGETAKTFAPLLNARERSYAIKAVAARDGNTVEAKVNVTVNKATPVKETHFTAPAACENLIFNTEEQALLVAGKACEEGLSLWYRLGDAGESGTVPTATAAGNYEISWGVRGCENYNDYIAQQPITVSIAPKSVTSPTIVVADGSVYNGELQKPEVTVYDGETLIPSAEYTVDYENNLNAGTASVTITDNPDGNYVVSGTSAFSIAKAAAPANLLSLTASQRYTDTSPKTISVAEIGMPSDAGKLTYSIGQLPENVAATVGEDGLVTYSIANGVAEQVVTIPLTISSQNYKDAKTKIVVTLTGKDVPILSVDSITVEYTGEPILKERIVGTASYDGETVEGSWSWKNGVAPVNVSDSGDWTVIFTPDDAVNYEVTESTVAVTIVPKSVTNPTIVVADGSVYNGKLQKPEVTVYDGETLISSAEYTVTYENNLNAGTASIIVTDNPNGNYVVSGTSTFSIEKADAPTNLISLTASQRYTDTSTKTISAAEIGMPSDAGKLTYSIGQLPENVTATVDEDGLITYFIASGVAGQTVTIPLTISSQNYEDAETKIVVTLTGKDIPVLNVDPITVEYTGEPISKELIVGTASYDGKSVEGSWTWKNGTAPVNVSDSGSWTVIFTPDDAVNYEVTEGAVAVTIMAKSVTSPTIVVADGSVYNGEPQKPEVTVYDGEVLVSSAEYTVTYENNLNAGMASIIVTDNPDGNYVVSGTSAFSIAARSVTNPKIVVADGSVYNGEPQRPEVTVYDGEMLIPSAEYTVTYENNLNAGTASVTITDNPDGNYVVSGTSAFSIAKAAAPANLLSLTASQRYTDTSPKTISAAEIGMPTDAGKLTYSLGQLPENVTATVGEDGLITYSIASGAAGQTVTIPLTIGSQNYEDAEIKIVVTLTGKDVPILSINPITAEYTGEPILKERIVGTASYDGKSVEGSWSWKNGVAPVNASDSGDWTVVFTPTDGDNYEVAEGTVAVTITPKSIADAVITLGEALTYNGSAQVQTLESVILSEILLADKDYTITENTATDAGEYTLTITGIGNYGDFARKSWGIAPKSVTNPTIVIADGSVYNGELQKPEVTVYDGETLISSAEYTVTYENNLNAGTAGVTITDNPDGNYVVSGTSTFSIEKAAAPTNLILLTASQRYTDTSPKTISVAEIEMPTDAGKLTYSIGQLSENVTATVDEDGLITYSIANGVAGQTVTIPLTIGSQNYKDAETKVVITLTGKDVPILSTNPITVEYTGEPISKERIVGTASYDGKSVAGSWSWKNGTAPVNVSDSGDWAVIFTPTDGDNYEVTEGMVAVTITAKSITSPTIVVTDGSVYNGELQKPEVTVYDGETLISSAEYTVTYENNLNAGTASVTITDNPDGNYVVSGTSTFSIAPKNVANPFIIIADGSVYNGELQKPEVTVYDGETLIPSAEYTVTYENNLNAGMAGVTITDNPDGNYVVSGTSTFSIAPKSVTSPTIVVADGSVYNGEPQRPEVTVYDGETLIPSAEYTVDYENNLNAGMAGVTITDNPDGNYVVSGTSTFSIEKVAAPANLLSLTASQRYTDTSPKTLSAADIGMPSDAGKLTYSLGQLPENVAATVDEDGVVTYTVIGGVAEQTVSIPLTIGSQNYEDAEIKIVVTLTGKDIPVLTVSPITTEYTGEPISKELIVGTASYDGKSVEGSWSWKNGVAPVNASDSGDWTVVFTPTDGDNYEVVEGMVAVTIVPKSIADAVITLGEALTYNGSAQMQTLESVILSEILACDKDYSITGNTATDAGEYTLTITGIGNYGDFAQKSWSIAPKSVTSPTIVVADDSVYNGELQKPEVTVYDGETLIPSAEYTVTYENNLNAGTASVTITDNPDGNYVVSGTSTFSIEKVAAPANLLSLTASQRYTDTSPKTLSAADIGMPSDAGKLTYSLGQLPENVTATVNEDGLITYSIANGAAGQTVTIPLTISSQNYEDAEIKIVVTLTGKDIPVLTVSPITTEYTGEPISKELIVGTASYDGKSVEGSWSWKNGVAPVNASDSGDWAVIFTPTDRDNYEVTEGTVAVTITAKSIADAVITLGEALTYNGKAQTQEVVNIALIGMPLTDKDYTITGNTATDAGEYTLTITGIGNYGDFARKSWGIAPKSVTSPTIVVADDSVYNGEPQKPEVTVYDGETLIPSAEYTVTYENNLNAGMASVTITDNPDGNYVVSGTSAFSIAAKNVTNPRIVVADDSVYNGELQKPEVTVYDGETLISSAEYTVTYENNLNAGMASIIVTDNPDGNYVVSGTSAFSIAAKNVTNPRIVVVDDSVYNGELQKPEVTVYDGETLIPSAEYTVDYENNLNAGTASIIVTDNPNGNYVVSGTSTFSIAAKNVTNPRIEVADDSVYNGELQKPEVTVYDGEVLVSSAEYTVTYENNLNAGMASIIVTDNPDGNYVVSGTSTFSIEKAAAPTNLISLTASQRYTDTSTKTLSAADIGMPSDAGKLMYSLGQLPENVTATVDEDGLITYSIANGVAEQVVTIPLTIGSQNYKDAETKIVVTLTGKDVPILSVNPITVEYTGEPITKELIVGTASYDGKSVEGSWTWKNGVAPVNASDSGSWTVIFTPDDAVNYEVTEGAVAVTITARSATNPRIVVADGSVYNGELQKPEVTVYDGETLIPSAEYTVTYENNLNAGTASIIVTDNPDGNYVVSGTSTFSIEKADAPTNLISLTASQRYTDTSTKTLSAADIGMPSDAGKLMYSLGLLPENVTATVDEDGLVTYSIANGVAGQTVSIPLTIGSQNYKDAKTVLMITLLADAAEDTPKNPVPVVPATPAAPKPLLPTPTEQMKLKFADVPEDAYYAEAVAWAVQHGITGGIGNGLFAPELSCTRAQIVTLLWRAFGSPAPKERANPFVDVSPDDYFSTAVLWAVENGITTGVGENAFDPNGRCTRAQAVTFLYRCEKMSSALEEYGETEIPFTDVPQWCYASVAWCYQQQITGGTGMDTFSPEAHCTRGQIVTLLYRYCANR